MIGKDYFDTTEIICSKRIEASEVKKNIERLDTAISVVSEFPSEAGVVIEVDELNKVEEQLNFEVMDIYYQQEVLFEELATLRADKAHLESQVIVAKNALMESSEDYEFAESLEEDIECPTCGVVHDNSIVNRFSLLQDKKRSEDMIIRLDSDLVIINDRLEEKNIEFNGVRNKIKELDKKYSSDDSGKRTFSSILESIASNSVKRKWRLIEVIV
jgi:chromosome segregation ATPase